MAFDIVEKLSPMPVINLSQVSIPSSGKLMNLPDVCSRNFSKDSSCKGHYERLSSGEEILDKVVQCPYGFASIAFRVGGSKVAITGFIPYPRLGGEPERLMAKRYKNIKIASESVEEIIKYLKGLFQEAQQIEKETMQKHSLALHEIRKLNRTVIQMAERLCQDASPGDLEAAPLEMLNIWKAAELMSKQFDIIEILANERLTELPLNTAIHPYRIFDKCVRVYRVAGTKQRIILYAPYNYSPRIYACDKTFPIIPTTLIENATKYALSDSEIRISLEPRGEACLVNVSSLSAGQGLLDESIFLRGVRASKNKDGSGNGLYIAQLIARQHNSQISVQSRRINPVTVKHDFSLKLNIIS